VTVFSMIGLWIAGHWYAAAPAVLLALAAAMFLVSAALYAGDEDGRRP